MAGNCEDIRVLISAWLDGEATARESELVFEHLASCEACRNFLDELEAARHSLHSQLFPEDTESLDLRLLESLRAAARERVPWWRRRVFVPLPLAAAVVLALVTALIWAMGMARQQSPTTFTKEETVVRTIVIEPEDVTVYSPSSM